MERQWLREQVGGRIASQDRLRAERSATIRIPSPGQATGDATRGTPVDTTPALSSWKAWKRSFSSSAKRKSKRKGRLQAARTAVAGSFLRALFGRASSSIGVPTLIEAKASRRPTLKRCPRCGKVVKRRKAKDLARLDAARSSDPAQEKRANADKPLPKPAMPSAPPPSAPARNSNTGTPSTSTRRPHVYSMLDSSRSGFTLRTIPSAYTHVCRRKSKSSNEWNRIKFMVGIITTCQGFRQITGSY